MSIIDDALKKTQAKLEKRKGREGLKSYDRPNERQDEKGDTVSGQVPSDLIKEKTVWYKNTYTLLSIFLSVAGLIYTVLHLSGKPSLSVKPNSSELQNLSDQSTLSTQKSVVTPDLSDQSTLPLQKSIVIPN